jgi:hypothetical protein
MGEKSPYLNMLHCLPYSRKASWSPWCSAVAIRLLFVVLLAWFYSPSPAQAEPILIAPSFRKTTPLRPAVRQLRKMTQFSTQMVEEEVAVEGTPLSIQEIMTELNEVEKQYIDLLDEGGSATGLFATGEYTSDYRNGEDKYYGQLELRLFNDGYFEDQRKEDKKILQTRLELLQLNRDMDDRALQDELYRLHALENTLHYIHSVTRIQLLEKTLTRKIPAERNGYTTTTDVLEIRQALDTTRREQDFYAKRERHKLEPELAAVLNNIESLQLKDKTNFDEIAEKNSRNLAIQDVFIKRAAQFPAWSDNLAVDLFAGRRKEFFDVERNYVGIKLEVPLSWDGRKDDLIELQQRIYRFQKEAAALRIRQNIDKLSAYFAFYQQKIESTIGILRLLVARQQAAENELRNPIQRNNDDPQRLLHTLELKIIDTRFEALQYRLKEYELMLKIMALTGIKDIRELFVFESAQPGSPDHSEAPRQRHPGPG